MLLSCAPNAMPSLHLAGALLIWWNCGASRWGRVLAAVYLVLTVVATLGFGEHYVVDLIVAVPYSLLIQTLAAENGPRLSSAWIALTTLTIWGVILTFFASALGGLPILLWTLSLATIALSEWGRRRLRYANGAVE